MIYRKDDSYLVEIVLSIKSYLRPRSHKTFRYKRKEKWSCSKKRQFSKSNYPTTKHHHRFGRMNKQAKLTPPDQGRRCHCLVHHSQMPVRWNLPPLDLSHNNISAITSRTRSRRCCSPKPHVSKLRGSTISSGAGGCWNVQLCWRDANNHVARLLERTTLIW